MKQPIKLLSILLLQVTFVTAHAQDFEFSQFYKAPLLRNPALAGVFDGDVRLIGVFRNQWQSVTVPFQTSSASAEIKFPIAQQDDWITVALQITYDVAGDIKLKRTQLLPALNYHKSLGGPYDSYLSLAFMGGPVNDQFINGEFDPNSPTQTFDRSGFSYWDASTGFRSTSCFGEAGKYYIGAAL